MKRRKQIFNWKAPNMLCISLCLCHCLYIEVIWRMRIDRRSNITRRIHVILRLVFFIRTGFGIMICFLSSSSSFPTSGGHLCLTLCKIQLALKMYGRKGPSCGQTSNIWQMIFNTTHAHRLRYYSYYWLICCLLIGGNTMDSVNWTETITKRRKIVCWPLNRGTGSRFARCIEFSVYERSSAGVFPTFSHKFPELLVLSGELLN